MKVDREEDTCIYLRFVHIFISYAVKFVCMYIYMIQKEKINNWIIQFLKNEPKTFLVLQKIFYSL